MLFLRPLQFFSYYRADNNDNFHLLNLTNMEARFCVLLFPWAAKDVGKIT